jgi:hypothetical protein
MGLSFSQRLGLRLGIEELAEGATGETVMMGDDIGRDSIMEADSLENEFSEVEEVNGEIAKLEKTSETLENIVLSLEAMQANSLNGDTWRFYNLSLENALVVSGNTASDSDKAKEGESAADNKNKILAMIEAIWKAIKSFYNKLADTIKGWLMHLFDTAGRMKKNVQALQEKLKGIKDNPNAALTGNHNALVIGETFPEPALIVNNVENMTDVSSKVLTGEFSLGKEGFIKQLVQAYKDLPEERVLDGIKMLAMESTSFDKIKVLLIDHIRGLSNDGGLQSKDVPKELQEDSKGKIFLRSVETFGNRIQYITLPEEDKNAKEPATFREWVSKIKFGTTTVTHNTKETEKVPVMPVNDISACCKELLTTLDNVIKYKDIWFKTIRTRFNFIDGMQVVSKEWSANRVVIAVSFKSHDEFVEFQKKNDAEKKAFIAEGTKKFAKVAGDCANGIFAVVGKQDSFEAATCKNIMRSCSDVISYLSDCTKAHAGT